MMRKRIVAGLFMALALVYNGSCPARAEEHVSALGTSAKAAALIEYHTGRVLYAYNADAPLPMASTTKVMTALLALENGALTDVVTAGRNAFGVPGTSIYLEEGEQLTLEQMLYGLMLASGNDAAVAIAEHIGGSVSDFCAMMTRRAAQLGCENTAFSTPHGLPADNHYTTALDLARIAREAMGHGAFREIVSTQRATIPWQGRAYDRVLNNKNALLSTYEGATGIKTGYTKAAGRCLVFGAQREGLEVIGVVLGCPDWFGEAARIMDYAFETYEYARALRAGETVRMLPVTDGVERELAVITGGELAAPVQKGRSVKIELSLPGSVAAGVRAFDEVGTARLVLDGEILCETPLLAACDVPPKTFRYHLERSLAAWPLLP